MREHAKKTIRVNLTKATIAALEAPQGKRAYVYDAKQRGLAICITPAGTRTFYACRKLHGRTQRVRLGTWPDLNVNQARTAAAEAIALLGSGTDPSGSRRENRKAPTLKDAFDDYIAQPTRSRAKRPKSPKTVKDYRLQFNRYLAEWHEVKLTKIQRADVEKRHNDIATAYGAYTANRVLSLIRALYNAAIDAGHVKENPAARIRAFEEESRERYLTAEEMPRFFEAVQAEPSDVIRDFIWLCIYTGARSGSVKAIRWKDIHLERAIWAMPGGKAGAYEVPLVEPALDVLRRRQAANGDHEYVLPGRHGRGHLKDPMRAWRSILERAGIEDLRIHDLRRTCGSWQVMTGASLPIIGRSLGHRRAETTSIYARMSNDPVRAAMGLAADAIAKAASEKGGEA